MLLHMRQLSHLLAAECMRMKMLVPELPGVNCGWAGIYLTEHAIAQNIYIHYIASMLACCWNIVMPQ
jgi:hypothetical protein